MTSPSQESQVQDAASAQSSNSKELNFRALEAKYQRQLDQANQARIEAEKRAEIASQVQHKDEDEIDSEPYVDHKKLSKTLAKFGEQNQKQTETQIQKAVNMALQEERKQNWIKNNPDFYQTLQLADKFAEHDPELAETILEMPEGFERQKLVYKNIKALGLHNPKPKESSIQEKIDANRRSPYYQPSGISSSPYSQQGDFSQVGQKNAYEKMQALKNQLRI
jgi:hypothetical protein